MAKAIGYGFEGKCNITGQWRQKFETGRRSYSGSRSDLQRHQRFPWAALKRVEVSLRIMSDRRHARSTLKSAAGREEPGPAQHTPTTSP